MSAATESVSLAITRAGQLCFKPFSPARWFAIGLMAFVSGYVSNFGFQSPTNFTGGSSGTGSSPGVELENTAHDFLNWLELHLTQIILIGAIVFVLWLCFIALLSWLRCHTKFIFMDNIYKLHSLIVVPWRETRPLANSLFLFTIVYGTALMLIYVGILILCGFIAWPAIQSHSLTRHVWIALFTGAGILVPTFLVSAIVFAIVDKILVPIMYLRQIRMMPALHVFRTEILPGNIGQILLFFLIKFAAAIAFNIVGTIIGCITCCCGFIPYISTVLTLPLHVFSQSYDMYFVAHYLKIVFPIPAPEASFPITPQQPPPFQ